MLFLAITKNDLLKANFLQRFVLFVIFGITVNCWSQQAIYTHFGIDEGLPSSEVYDCFQDKEGYIWFATDRGIARYNGYEFENFTTDNGLPGDVILDFYVQPNGQVWSWSFHSKKLFYFDQPFNGFKIYPYNNKLKPYYGSNTTIESLVLDEKGTLHLGGEQLCGPLQINAQGDILNVSRVKKCKSTKYVIPKVHHYSVSSFYMSCTPDNIGIANKKGTKKILYLKKAKTIVLINGFTVTLINEKGTQQIIENGKMPLGIKKVDDNHFFIGYKYGGATIVNTSGKIVSTFLSGESITNFLIDHEGGYWFTTLDSGVYYTKNPSIKKISNSPLENQNINSIARTASNTLLVACNNGTIFTIDTKGKVIKQKTNTTKLGAAVVTDTINEINYIYDGAYLHVKSQRDSFAHKTGYLLKLSEPQNGKLLLSTLNSIDKVDRKNYKRITNGIRNLDACYWNDILYTATPKGLFYMLNNELKNIKDRHILLSQRIEDIDVGPNNLLYLGTIGSGLVIHAPTKTYAIDKSNGLYSNNVNEVYIENEHTIWVCTDSGLNKINFTSEGYTISGLSITDGLINNEIETLEIIDDMVWIGTKKGACYFPKSIIDHKLDTVNFLKIKKLTVNNNEFSTEAFLKFNHDENNIEFLIEGISFYEPTIHYNYQLEGLNEQWYTTTNRNIIFPSLPPGNYTLKVKACNQDTICSEYLASYSFKIRFPFWQRWWFYGLTFLAVVALIYGFFKVKILSCNKDITRELIRVLVKKLKKEEPIVTFKEGDKTIRIPSNNILYVSSSKNYVQIYTSEKKFLVRCKIGEFISTTPDPLEYVRVHRSYIVRIDKVKAKSKSEVVINDAKIPVSKTYTHELEKILF